MNFFFKFYQPKTDRACFSSTDIYYNVKNFIKKKHKLNKKECYFFHYK